MCTENSKVIKLHSINYINECQLHDNNRRHCKNW